MRFRAGRPQIEIDVEERTTPLIYRSVREGLADVGIASEFASHEGLQVFPYRRYALAAVLPVGHALAQAPQLAYAQLLGDDLVELSRDSGISQVFDDAARDARTSRTVRARVSSFETICTLVAQGMGVGVVPLYLKAAKEESLGLRFVPLADDWARPAHLRASAGVGGN
jgi:DNA-binding transcriptional LysR family regulator